MMLLTKIEPEAFFTVSEQTELFLLSVLAGVTFGVLWDVFRALRVMLPPMRSTALTAVCDALYMIICGLGLYIFSLLFARGEIRAFYWLGALLGAVIYILTAGTVIMGFLRWLFGGIYGMPRKKVRDKITELLQELGFETERKRMVKSLPLGWKQKLAFSLAIFHEPSIVFLDEPTGGVDPVTRRQFWELIYRAADNGITVFVTTHYMDEAEYCDRVSIMVDGRIDALGSPAQLKRQFNGNSMYDVFYALARTAKRGD